ncbi:MAG: hypothetical protein H6753_02975 [Candidatus Omnitrophica bacterium]|nr:hypothetical protein [Candidatus Omnitrophota bacterium]
MDKEQFSDDKFYNYSADEYNNPKDGFDYEGFDFYSIPYIDRYFYKDYERLFATATQDLNFIWFPCQRQKLSEFEFNQIKIVIEELKNNKNPSQKEINNRRAFLENKILLNSYQFFTYQDYLKACQVLLEVDGSKHTKDIIYNPPLDEKRFLIEKDRIIKCMVGTDQFFPYGISGGNTIFPSSCI